MDDFKLISIDDFDSDFKQSMAAKEPAEDFIPMAEPDYLNSGRDSIIPEVLIEEKPVTVSPAQPKEEEPKSAAAVATAEPKTEEQTAQQESFFNRPAQNLSGSADRNIISVDFSATNAHGDNGCSADAMPEGEEAGGGSKKNGIGRLISKIAAICLLAVTIVSFVMGCFVSVFLDNRNVDLKGYSMCTVRADVEDVSWLKKGSLVVLHRVEPSAIRPNQVIVAYDDKDVPFFFAVSSTQKGNSGEYTVIAAQMGGSNQSIALGADSVAGVAVRYIPHIAGIITFAMNQALLVCALFILLVVFLGLIIVLIEKTKIQ